LGLLFQVGVLLPTFGLKSNLKNLLKILKLNQGIGRMAVPLGYSWMKGMDSTNLVSIFVGASIAVASIGVIAKVLSE